MNSIINKTFACEFIAPEDLNRQNREYHIRRIAHFVVNGWEELIQIDVITSIPELNEFKIYDGRHRLVAAIFRCDTYISAVLKSAIEERVNDYLEQFGYR